MNLSFVLIWYLDRGTANQRDELSDEQFRENSYSPWR